MSLTCPTCRTTYSDGLTYCPRDGSQLQHDAAPAPASPPAAVPASPPAAAPAATSAASGAFIGALVGLVVVLGGVLAFVLTRPAPAVVGSGALPAEAFGGGGVASESVASEAAVQPARAESSEPDARGAAPAAPPPDRDLVAVEPAHRDVSYGPARVVTDGDGLLLRSGPGRQYDVLGKMLPGDVVTVEDCEPGAPGTRWCRVVYGGVPGYTHDEFLDDRGVSRDTQTGLEEAFAAAEPFGVSAYIDATEVRYVNLRARPFSGAEVLTRMRPRAALQVVRCLPPGWSLGGQPIQGRWCFVNATTEGRTVSGWASDGALRW